MNHVVTLGLTAALAWGVWAVLADVAVRSLPPESTMILSYGASVVLAAGYVAVRGVPLRGPPAAVGAALAAGVFAGIGAVSYYGALRAGTAGVATTLAALYFVVAALLGAAVLGDSLELSDVAGIACAALAVVLIAR